MLHVYWGKRFRQALVDVQEGSTIRRLTLSWATGDYDHVRALIDGSVKPEGIDLVPLVMRAPERHWRMLRHEEFDVCELSMSSYIMCKCQGREFIAIPVFPHRRFRHSYIFCSTKSVIDKPTDLNNKKVGLRTFQATAGVWARGILQHEFGVDLKSIQWFTQDPEDIELPPGNGFKIERIPEGSNIDTLVCTGELDAAIYPEVLPSVLKGSPAIKRLFGDYKQVEMDYYKRNGIFPIMHTVVIKTSVVREHPWVPVSLLKAFREALRVCYERMRDPRRYPLAWVLPLVEEQWEVLGHDPWCWNLKDNRKALETLIQYELEQGLIPRRVSVDELFAESTREETPDYV